MHAGFLGQWLLVDSWEFGAGLQELDDLDQKKPVGKFFNKALD